MIMFFNLVYQKFIRKRKLVFVEALQFAFMVKSLVMYEK